MNLYLCEKPSQAKDLAAVLGANKRGDGCILGNGVTITWAYGHLLEQFMPDDYDPAYKQWNMDLLPIIPEQWKSKPKKAGLKQYKVIQDQVKKASTVYIATDYDREGEVIARELLDRFKYRGPIKRVPLRSLDELSIREALADTLEDYQTKNMYFAGLARTRADWLVGMNFSRLFTAIADAAGTRQTFHIGRVITPLVGLVVARDNSIKQFVPEPYYELDVSVQVQRGTFKARWIPPEEIADEEGRCKNRTYADQVHRDIQGQHGTIERAETTDHKESAPLPFSLSALQMYCSKRWGYTAQQVLDTAQSLYEEHKATSYPRTDSRYLPESQREQVRQVFQAMMLSDPDISGLVAGADPDRKARAFNDGKVDAHHAIIPTRSKCDLAKFNERERNVYDAIRRHYVAQFYAPFEYKKTEVLATCRDNQFKASGKVPTVQGWKVIFQNEPKDNEEGAEQDDDTILPPIHQGEPAVFASAQVADKMTRPAPHFTEAALLSAMANIARFVDEPKFKAILKETAGLGTEATRAGILEGAFTKGYLKREKKTIRATDKGHAVIGMVPKIISSPGMTAAWEQELEKIASGNKHLDTFIKEMETWLSKLVNQIKDVSDTFLSGEAGAQLKALAPVTYPCFNCGSDMRRIRGKKGFFWACRSDACKKTFNDNRGKPEDPSVANKPAKNAPECPECSAPMLKRKGKSRDGKSNSFWGCSRYPDCKGIKNVTQRKRKKSSA